MEDEAGRRDTVERFFKWNQFVEFSKAFLTVGMFGSQAIYCLLEKRLSEINIRHVHPRDARASIFNYSIDRQPAFEINARHCARGSCRSSEDKTGRVNRRTDPALLLSIGA